MIRAPAGAWLLAALAWCAPAAGYDFPADPGEALAALEARLLAAPSVGLQFRVTSSGAFESDLSGELELTPDRTALSARGEFGGSPAGLELEQAAGKLTGGNGKTGFDGPAAPATDEALLVGLVRMGILHNLARLAADLPPDHADGGAADWVTLHDPAWGPGGPWDGRNARALSFRIRVAGRDSGQATLWLSESDGIPVAREQTVKFPGGEMQVLERYPVFRLPRP